MRDEAMSGDTGEREPDGAWEGLDLEAILSGAGDRVGAILEAAERAAEGILADAEAQAKSYIEEATQRADRLTLERVREMSELSDRFLAQATAVQGHSDALIAALEQAVGELGLDSPDRLEIRDPEETPLARRSERLGRLPAGAAPDRGEEAGAPSVTEAEPAAKGNHFAPEEHVEADTDREPTGRSRFDAFVSSLGRRSKGEGGGDPESGERAELSEGARLLAIQMAMAGSSREEIVNRLRDEFGIEDLDELVERVTGEREEL